MKACLTILSLLACLPFLFCGIRANCAPQSVAEQIQAFAAEDSLSNLTAVKVDVESLWTNEPTLYFQSNNQLEAVLEALSKTNSTALQELEIQAQQTLSRKCPTNSIDATAACFDAKQQITMRLINNVTPSISNALALAEFLGEVRTTIITNYQRADVYANIVPPLMPKNTNGMGYFEGMAPSLITDPVARAAYEKAIADNGNNGKMNDFQIITLPEINRTMTSKFFYYVNSLPAKETLTKKQVSILAEVARLTKVETEKLKGDSN
jgi:hypothetical protein